MSDCNCPRDEKCNRLGLCQIVAKAVMPGPEPQGRPVMCECDLELTLTELDRGRCACCGGVLLCS